MCNSNIGLYHSGLCIYTRPQHQSCRLCFMFLPIFSYTPQRASSLRIYQSRIIKLFIKEILTKISCTFTETWGMTEAQLTQYTRWIVFNSDITLRFFTLMCPLISVLTIKYACALSITGYESAEKQENHS